MKLTLKTAFGLSMDYQITKNLEIIDFCKNLIAYLSNRASKISFGFRFFVKKCGQCIFEPFSLTFGSYLLINFTVFALFNLSISIDCVRLLVFCINKFEKVYFDYSGCLTSSFCEIENQIGKSRLCTTYNLECSHSSFRKNTI